MLAYRDFTPKLPGVFQSARTHLESFESALVEANDWLSREPIDLINVETVGMDHSAFAVKTLRVWYRTTAIKPPTTPDV
jgi:hypothetical protein